MIDTSPAALKSLRAYVVSCATNLPMLPSDSLVALLDALEEARALLLKVEGKLVKEGCVYTTEPIGIELSAWRRRNRP